MVHPKRSGSHSRSERVEPSRPAGRVGEIRDCYVVGDAVWELLAARRAGMLSVGVLTGGYGEDELLGAGAFRVYRGVDELQASIDELGI